MYLLFNTFFCNEKSVRIWADDVKYEIINNV